jgi:hypothetical protein
MISLCCARYFEQVYYLACRFNLKLKEPEKRDFVLDAANLKLPRLYI